MVRRTKLEALETRARILDAAELVFEQHGVSGTSLHDIARAAGVSRGAIYWHFDNKAALFNAMMERVTLPMEDADAGIGFKGPDITLAQIRTNLLDVLRRVASDPQLRRVFGIALHKVEYVGEMTAVHEHHLAMRDACVADLERGLERAVRGGLLPRRVRPREAALGLVAVFDGLLLNWMLDRSAFDLLQVGRRVLDAYLRGLGATPG